MHTVRNEAQGVYSKNGTLIVENRALQAKLAAYESHGPDGHNVTNAQLVEVRDKLAAAEEALLAYIEAYTPDGHVAPHDCFSTGPLTGGIVADMLACPGCIAKKKSDAIFAGHAPAPTCTCGSLKVKNNKSEWVCVECQGEGHAPATPQQAHLAQSGELWVGPEEDE